MAFRTWAKVFFATLGIGALTGAGELGMAYGLGIVRLTRVVDVTARDEWTAQLAWVTWFPMVAAVVGAVTGARLLRRWAPGFRGGVGMELTLSFAAAIGAAVVVPLTMQPARTAQIAGVDAVVVIAICTGLGALVGVFAAWGALAQAVARWSLTAMSIAIGVLAIVSVSPSLAPSDPLPAVRLGVLDATFLSSSVTQRTALATMPALALLTGVIVGWVARRREMPTLTIALAGLPGPALLTVAYLIAGPGSGDDRYQMTPYWAAMTAAGAGVLGSVLAAVLRRPPAVDEDEDGRDGPTEGRPPLPRRPDQKESAIAAAGSPAPGSPAGSRAPGSPAGSPAASPSADRPAASPSAGGPAEPPLRPADTAVFDTPAIPAPRKTGNAPQPQHSVPLGEYTTEEPQRFDGFARTPAPYVPEPATRPLLPEALHAPTAPQPVARQQAAHQQAARQQAATPRPTGGQTGRSVRPVARGRTAEPLVPEPTAVSAPLPHPQPATPLQPAKTPRPVAPHENRPAAPHENHPIPSGGRAVPAEGAQNPADTTPRLSRPIGPPVTDPATILPKQGSGKSRFGLRRRKDEDYVDWVSGLGD
jgi:hypothetical protein